jgi:hypothetical protein
MRVALFELRLTEQIGAGAQGTVYRVSEPVPLALPFPVVLKRFHPSTAVASAALARLAQFRTELADEHRAFLDEHAAWPCAAVDDGGRTVGYLMRVVPDEYWQTIRVTTGEQRIPREAQHLFLAAELAERNLGETADVHERLVLAQQLAGVLALLHGASLVFGDLSYRNEVYALRPRPSIMLLDCDAVRHVGEAAAIAQLDSPGWRAPEGGPQTVASDCYKLGLFVLRILTPGHNAQNRDPAAADHQLDREGRRLLRAALGEAPRRRPAAADWAAYLAEQVARRRTPAARIGPPPPPAPPPARADAGADTTPPAGQPGGSPAGAAVRPAPSSTRRSARRAGRVRATAASPGPPTRPAQRVPPRRPRPHRVRPGHVKARPAAPTPAGSAPTRRTARRPGRTVAWLLGAATAIGLVVALAVALARALT